MKKLFILLAAALICAALIVPASAVRDWVEPVGDVYVPFVTTPPTLDGVISDGEWCDKATFVINDWNMIAVYTFGFMEMPEGWETLVNLAWDNDYLYVATRCKDPTATGRPFGQPQEGDYFRMYLDFGYAQDGMNVQCATIWCLVDDEENDHDLTSQTLFFVDKQSSGEWTEGSWGATGVEGEYWNFEGRVPWSILLETYEANTGAKVTPDVGMEATGLIYYVDFDETYTQINWFGTSLYGYDVDPWFGTSGFGINLSFVGSENDVKARPETTEPAQSAPEDTSAAPSSSAGDTEPVPVQPDTDDKPQTGAPITTEAAPKDEEGKSGLPTGAVIGIAAGAAVIIAGAVAIIIPKRKK